MKMAVVEPLASLEERQEKVKCEKRNCISKGEAIWMVD